MADKERPAESVPLSSGSVVWYHQNAETGWWPCWVTETSEDGVCLQSFGDDYNYGWVGTASPKLLPFACVGSKEKVQKQVSRLQKSRRKELLSTFVKAVREVLDREPSLQLDVDLPEVSMMQSPPPLSKESQDLWPFLNDSYIFTTGSSSKPARLTRSSLKKMTSTDRPPCTAADHSVPPGTTGSAKSDILVGRWKMIGNYGSVGKRKRQKSDGVSDEDDSTGSLRRSSPLRKKLEFDDTYNTNELATVENSPTRRIESESDKAAPHHESEEEGVVQQNSDITRQFEEVFEVEQKVLEQNVTGVSSLGDVDNGAISVTCPSSISPVEDGESGRGRRTTEEAKLEERRAVVEREEEVERGGEEGEEGGMWEGKREEQRKGEERVMGEEVDTSSSEEEDLPFLPNIGTEVAVNDLKEGDYVWCKWGRCPYWPSLVIKVHQAKRKKDATANIQFFGCNTNWKQWKIKYGSKIGRFVIGNSQFHDFMKAGRESNMAELFIKSVSEAETFITAKSKKELTGSVSEMFEQICERRPASDSLIPIPPEMTEDPMEGDSEVTKYSAFGFRLDSELMDDGDGENESDIADTETEREAEDSLYTLNKVLTYFTQLKPILEGIVCGSVQSEYHRMYTSGTAKERHGLGNRMKFGPCVGWNTDRQVQLISHLEEMAKEAISVERSQFQYARDVLLPEAMIRTISHFEGISEAEAERKL